MDIKKLCEEFHEKIGKEKSVRVIIDEGDIEDITGWVTGQMRPEIWEEMKERLKNHKHEPTSFMKLSKGVGIEYIYRADKITQEVKT